MNLKKIVDKLLESDERTVSWLGRKIGRSPQNLRHALLSENPQINLVKDISEVFEMEVSEFIKLGEEEECKEDI